MKRLVFSLGVVVLSVVSMVAQPTATYYKSSALDGKCGRTLELALKDIVYTHTQRTYNQLWTDYKTTDPGPTDSIPSSYTGSYRDLVYDMYAWMGHFPKFYSDNDHTQTGGINREHCVPNSWWGGESGNAIAYTDLHHLVPGDGAANNQKSNWPLGEYASGLTLAWPTSDQTNSSGNLYVTRKNPASHVWSVPSSKQSNYGGASRVFEPADEYKGDFARMYLYVVCAYEGELTWQSGCQYMFTSDSNKQTTIKDWALNLLLKWHRQDPVSDKERARNNAVYGIQKNRNPFIDYPDFVEYIWGNKSTATDLSMSSILSAYSQEYKDNVSGAALKTPASLSFVMNARLGQPFVGMTLTSTSAGTVTYTSSNPSVATVDATTGAVTLVARGTTVITATVAESTNFIETSEQYTINVE